VSARPKWYTPVAVVALLWNLIGVTAYLFDVTMSPEAIARLTPAQRALYEARPLWFVTAYAIAVWSGTAGALGLVLRKRWARGLLHRGQPHAQAMAAEWLDKARLELVRYRLRQSTLTSP